MIDKDTGLQPYAPPAAKQLDAVHSRAQTLLAEQSIVGTLVGAVSAAVPGYLLYTMILWSSLSPIVAFFLPGVAIGFGARWVGRGLTVSHRFAAAVVSLSGLGVCAVILNLNAFGVLLSLPNVIIPAVLTSRRLSREDYKALFDYRWQLRSIDHA